MHIWATVHPRKQTADAHIHTRRRAHTGREGKRERRESERRRDGEREREEVCVCVSKREGER